MSWQLIDIFNFWSGEYKETWINLTVDVVQFWEEIQDFHNVLPFRDTSRLMCVVIFFSFIYLNKDIFLMIMEVI